MTFRSRRTSQQNVMEQFGKSAKDLGPIVDQITAVTLDSQFGFDQYADAIGQAGGVAGSLGVSLTDFNAAITSTAGVFNSGADAGTSFKTFLLRLVPQSDAAAEKMKELGLEFFDATGKMKPMAEIAEELKTGLAGLSDEAKNDALGTIFGQDALRTAIALGTQGAAGINEVTASINRAGVAQEQADARTKGFNASLDKLSDTFKDLAISIGNSGVLETVTSVIDSVATAVSGLSKTSPEILKWGSIVAGVLAVGGPVIIGLGLLATAAAAISAPVAATVAALAALAAGGLALYQNWDVLKEKFPTITGIFETLGSVMATTASGLATQTALISQYLSQMLTGDLQGAGQTVTQIFTNLGSMFSNLAEIVFPGAVEAIKAKCLELSTAITDAFAALPGKMIEIGSQIIQGLISGIQSKFGELKAYVQSWADALPQWMRDQLGIHSPSRVTHEIGQFVSEGLANGIAAGAPQATAEAAKAAQSVSAQLSTVSAANGGDPWAGLRQATDGATDGLSQMQDMGQSVASTISSAFSSLIDGSKSLKETLVDALQSIGKSLLDSGLQALFGGGGAAPTVSGGGGGGFGSIISSVVGSLFGFAQGGTILPGGAGTVAGIDSQVVAFRKKPSEQVDIYEPGKMRARGASGASIRGGDVIIQGDVSEKNLQAIRDAIDANNRRLPEQMANWQDNPRRRFAR